MNAEQPENEPNLEELMALGIQTARQGNKQNARVLFEQILDRDPQNERAWLWMAAVAATPADRIRFLNTVLRLNPNNTTAQRELNQLQQNKETSNSQVIVYGAVGVGIILILIVITVLLLAVL